MGVLVGEALLENPGLFEGSVAGDRQISFAREYLSIQARAPFAPFLIEHRPISHSAAPGPHGSACGCISLLKCT